MAMALIEIMALVYNTGFYTVITTPDTLLYMDVTLLLLLL